MSVSKGIRSTPWLLGDKNPAKRPEVREKIRKGLLGKKLSEEHRGKLRKAKLGKTGEKANNWQGGISKTEDYHRRKYREWTDENRSYKCFLNGQRRAMKLGAEGSHTFGEWETLKAQYNWICPSCERREPEIVLSEDHIIPLILGGGDNIENIQPLCRSCNSIKHTKIIYYSKNNL